MRITYLCLALLTVTSVSANEPSAVRQAELRHLIKHDCGSCHGLTLKGGLGPSLLAKDLQHKPNRDLVQTIQQGRPGTAMPPWAPFISLVETRWLVENILKKP